MRRSQNKGRDTTSQKREAQKLDFEAWLDVRNFRIWQMNVRSEVSPCASRPIEAMVWISEMQSSKSIVELKTSYSITGAKLQTNFAVLESQIASALQKIINGDFKRRVFIQDEAAQKRKTPSHGKASRLDGLRIFQDQRHRRIRLAFH